MTGPAALPPPGAPGASRGDHPEGPSEAGLSWIKGPLSFSNSNCVEVASLTGSEVAAYDSKDPACPVLRHLRVNGMHSLTAFEMACSGNFGSSRYFPPLSGFTEVPGRKSISGWSWEPSFGTWPAGPCNA